MYKYFAWVKKFSFGHSFSSFLEVLGGYWLVTEMTSHFWPDSYFYVFLRDQVTLFILAAITFGIYRGRPISKVKSRISNTDIEVEIIIGDIFKNKGAIIIGSNTTFDTSIEDETISAKSIQGQFTMKYCPNISELDIQLGEALRTQAPVRTLTEQEKPYGKTVLFPIGTVATIVCKKKRAYFCAIANLNMHKVAICDTNELLDTLPVIWSYIQNCGTIDDLSCPILGSRYGRINLSREELIRSIIKSFVAASLEQKFCEKFSIYISDDDYITKGLDIKRLGEFLKHECSYSKSIISRRQQNTPTGIPVN